MNNGSKNKTLIIIIVLLLISNIFLVGFYMFKNKTSHRTKGKDDGFVTALKNDVGFSEEQLKKFSELKETNWTQAKERMNQVRKLRSQIFDLTRQNSVADSTVERIADSIAILQKQFEIKSYNHFKETRAICTPQQQAAYDSLMKKIINRPRGPRTGAKK